MRVLNATAGTSSVELTADEVLLLANAMNEVLNGICVLEFETRLGVSEHTAEQLRNRLHDMLVK